MDNYSCIQGYECLAGSIANYMYNQGSKVNESDIFICGGGFLVQYSGNLQSLDIGTKSYDAVFRFLKKYKVAFEHGRVKENSNPLTFIEDKLKKNYRILIRVMTRDLTYHSIYRTSPSAPHWINVIMKTEKGFIISDCAIPSLKREVFCGELINEELINAWRGMYFEYMILTSEFADKLNVKKIKEDSKNKFLKDMKKYFSPRQKVFQLSKSGIEAIPKLLKDLIMEQWFDKEQLITVIQEINYLVKIKGIVSHKYLLLSKAKELGWQNLEVYEEAIRSWNNLFLKLLKVGITGKMDQMEVLINMANELNERERNWYEKNCL